MARGKNSASTITKLREELAAVRASWNQDVRELRDNAVEATKWKHAFKRLQEQGQPQVRAAERQMIDASIAHDLEVARLKRELARVVELTMGGIQSDGGFALLDQDWDELVLYDPGEFVTAALKRSVSNSSRQTRRNIERNVGNVVGLGD